MERIDTENEAAAESRALVVTGPPQAPYAGQPSAHPSATFLTQLLAMRAGVPQTRERRRAEPDEATHSYELTMSPLPPRTGRMLSRAM